MMAEKVATSPGAPLATALPCRSASGALAYLLKSGHSCVRIQRLPQSLFQKGFFF